MTRTSTQGSESLSLYFSIFRVSSSRSLSDVTESEPLINRLIRTVDKQIGLISGPGPRSVPHPGPGPRLGPTNVYSTM